MSYKWKWTKEGRMAQVRFVTGEDIARLAELDQKYWAALSMPTTGVRFDARMLELMDADGDGRIRTPEVIAAIDFLKAKNVNLDDLLTPSEADGKKLADVLARQADLAASAPSAADKQALADWEAKGKTPEVAVFGEATAAGEAALAAVESVIDAFFAPPEDMPLVTEAPDVTLPLRDHLNPKHLEAIMAFADACVKPVLGDGVTSIDRIGWKKVKAAFAPYRAWVAAKPVMNAGKLGDLVDEERVLRYKLHLLEFLENFVSMRRLYAADESATFQMGTLRIDGKEMSLCFHVASEAAHSALSGKSNCCVLYLKLTRPSEKAERSVCAVVTAGAVAQLYVGRNGVFFDRDGKDWDAVVTKVVENQVSLAEAFWAPWRKLGEGVASTVKKFLGDKQAAAQKNVEAGTQNAQAGGAAMASSVAAIGIGVGMMGTAVAAIAAAVKGMGALQIALSIVAIVLVVSLPSVILTWFKLRQRDLGAILNAGGWAINRPMRFSMKRARAFTKCAGNPLICRVICTVVILAALAAGGIWHYLDRAQKAEAEKAAAEAAPVEAAPAQ
ncbi:MAG: hypothetical protein ACI4QF_08730 [Kiritimatiellia bacterium]